MIVPFDLWKVERKVMGQKPMLRPCLFQRDLRIGQRQFLKVMDLVRERVMVVLGHASLEQMKQDLGVLGIVLVPGVMPLLPRTGHG